MSAIAKNDGPKLTAWEMRRNENARANNEVLKAVGSTSAKIFGIPKAAPIKKPAPRKRTETVKREAPLPTRRSARVAGIDADAETLKRKFEVENESKAEEERAKRMRVGGDLDLNDITVEGSAWAKTGESLAKFQAFGRGAQPGIRTFTEDDIAETTDVDLKQMRERMGALKLYETFEVKGQFAFLSTSAGNLGAETEQISK